MTDILGPASDNAVTTRPARTTTRGANDTWFKDCSGPDTDDGTQVPADYMNDVLAQLRTALSSSGITRDNADDMLWRAMQAVGVRYAVDSGAANAIVAAFAPPVTALNDGILVLVKLSNDVTGATTIKLNANDPIDLKWPDGTALAASDAKAGALLLIGLFNGKAQLLCRMNGGGASSSPTLFPGQIVMWPLETPPTGALECDGSPVSRATYARLFGIIGTTYGAGNGTSTFNLPDLRGEFIRGWAHGSVRDVDRAARTNRGDGVTGDHVGTKQIAAVKAGDLPTASITLQINQNTANGPDGGGFGGGGTQPPTTIPVDWSGGVGNETRPRNVNMMFCIAY